MKNYEFLIGNVDFRASVCGMHEDSWFADYYLFLLPTLKISKTTRHDFVFHSYKAWQISFIWLFWSAAIQFTPILHQEERDSYFERECRMRREIHDYTIKVKELKKYFGL